MAKTAIFWTWCHKVGIKQKIAYLMGDHLKSLSAISLQEKIFNWIFTTIIQNTLSFVSLLEREREIDSFIREKRKAGYKRPAAFHLMWNDRKNRTYYLLLFWSVFSKVTKSSTHLTTFIKIYVQGFREAPKKDYQCSNGTPITWAKTSWHLYFVYFEQILCNSNFNDAVGYFWSKVTTTSFRQ